jgi:hypothetical protein
MYVELHLARNTSHNASRTWPHLMPAGRTTSTATWLSSVLPASATVVKAFNNLSAYTLLHGDPLTEHMKSAAASDDKAAAESVADFGRALGLEVSCKGLEAASSCMRSEAGYQAHLQSERGKCLNRPGQEQAQHGQYCFLYSGRVPSSCSLISREPFWRLRRCTSTQCLSIFQS